MADQVNPKDQVAAKQRDQLGQLKDFSHPQSAPLQVEDAGCKSSVLVRSVLLSNANSKFDWNSIRDYPPMPGASVVLEFKKHPGVAVTTDSQGREFVEVPDGGSLIQTRGNFCAVHDEQRRGYTVKSYQRRNPETKQPEVWLAFLPEPARLKVHVSTCSRRRHRAECEVVEQPGIPLAKVGVTFRQSDGSEFCRETNDEGDVKVDITSPGDVLCQFPSIVSDCGCRYRAECPAVTVNVPPGTDCASAHVCYQPIGTEILVLAYLRQSDGSNVPFRYPVKVSLLRGSPTSGTFIQAGETTPGDPAVFADLEAEMYTVRGATSEQGYELICEHAKGVVVIPAAGSVQNVALYFHRCLGRVRFLVLDTCGAAVPDATITLLAENNQTLSLKTDSSGTVEHLLEPGQKYAAKIAKQSIGAASMMPVERLSHDFIVSDDLKLNSFEFRLKPETFDIFGTVFQADGVTPLPHAVVEIRDDALNLIGTTTSDAHGAYRFSTGRSGQFFVNLRRECGVIVERQAAVVQSNVQVNITDKGHYPPPPPPPPSPHNGKLSQAVEQLTAFPILSESVSGATFPAGAPGGPGTGFRLNQVVQGALRDILAWRAKPSDHKGFLAALKTAFTSKDVEGHKQFRWTPRSYAVTTDLGSAVTGAQASIFTRAKVALDNALPLLDGLYPLRNDPDDEEADASRAVVRGEFTELVNELGQEGGPRVERVDAEFQLLLGVDIEGPPPQPETVAGALGRLREEFGFDDNDVNTVEEEQNLTNYFVVVDYITSLRTSWLQHRDTFKRGFLFGLNGDNVFLGTQLVHISRALAVVAESTQELVHALNSVFLGAAERQTTELRFRDNNAPLFISELLDWVERFASNDGPRLVQDAGKLGVGAFYPTIEKLVTLVGQARIRTGDKPTGDAGNQEPTQVPASYASARVQRALQELYEQLNNLEEFAHPFKSNRAKR